MPIKPTHTGLFVLKELQKNEVSLTAAAEAMCIQASTLSRFCTGKAGLSVDLAKRISVYLSVAATLLLSMQADYELSQLQDRHYTKIKPLTRNK